MFEAFGLGRRLTRLGDIKRRLDDQTGPAIDPSEDP